MWVKCDVKGDRDLTRTWGWWLHNRNNLIRVTAVVEFRGVVTLKAAGRKLMMKKPSGYKHHLLLCALFSSGVWPQLRCCVTLLIPPHRIGVRSCWKDVIQNSVIIHRKWYNQRSCSFVCACVCMCLSVSTRLVTASQTGAGLYHPPPVLKDWPSKLWPNVD